MTTRSSFTNHDLSACCTAFLQSNAALVAAMLENLPSDQHKILENLIASGGSFGIEALVDQNSNCTISLIGREPEGANVVYAVIHAPGAASGTSAQDKN